jgi:hypothetical protein
MSTAALLLLAWLGIVKVVAVLVGKRDSERRGMLRR